MFEWLTWMLNLIFFCIQRIKITYCLSIKSLCQINANNVFFSPWSKLLKILTILWSMIYMYTTLFQTGLNSGHLNCLKIFPQINLQIQQKTRNPTINSTCTRPLIANTKLWNTILKVFKILIWYTYIIKIKCSNTLKFTGHCQWNSSVTCMFMFLRTSNVVMTTFSVIKLIIDAFKSWQMFCYPMT